jgi:hypothetical protein
MSAAQRGKRRKKYINKKIKNRIKQNKVKYKKEKSVAEDQGTYED